MEGSVGVGWWCGFQVFLDSRVVGVDVGVGWWCGVLAWDFEVKALRSSSM